MPPEKPTALARGLFSWRFGLPAAFGESASCRRRTSDVRLGILHARPFAIALRPIVRDARPRSWGGGRCQASAGGVACHISAELGRSQTPCGLAPPPWGLAPADPRGPKALVLRAGADPEAVAGVGVRHRPEALLAIFQRSWAEARHHAGWRRCRGSGSGRSTRPEGLGVAGRCLDPEAVAGVGVRHRPEALLAIFQRSWAEARHHAG